MNFSPIRNLKQKENSDRISYLNNHASAATYLKLNEFKLNSYILILIHRKRTGKLEVL
jgi:hypothetical protein